MKESHAEVASHHECCNSKACRTGVVRLLPEYRLAVLADFEEWTRSAKVREMLES
jgi:hypothetical protein